MNVINQTFWTLNSMFDAAEIQCVLCSQHKVEPDEKQCLVEILTHPHYIFTSLFTQ